MVTHLRQVLWIWVQSSGSRSSLHGSCSNSQLHLIRDRQACEASGRKGKEKTEVSLKEPALRRTMLFCSQKSARNSVKKPSNFWENWRLKLQLNERKPRKIYSKVQAAHKQTAHKFCQRSLKDRHLESEKSCVIFYKCLSSNRKAP